MHEILTEMLFEILERMYDMTTIQHQQRKSRIVKQQRQKAEVEVEEVGSTHVNYHMTLPVKYMKYAKAP